MTRYSTSAIRALAAIVGVLVITAATPSGVGRKFYDDDPLTREPESQDASKVAEWEIDLFYDLAENLFGRPGDKGPARRAGNVNTIDEVPDSSWFTNRLLARPVSADEAARGPLTGSGPAPGTWSVVRPKQAGFAPGFTMRDAKGDLWFVSFDAKGFPEAATGAILVANKIFWTLGYWQVENFLVSVQLDQLVVAESATMRPPSGKERPMRLSDIEDVLQRSQRSPDGSYRAIAARAVPGRPLGGFRYHGTRPDDPERHRPARAPPRAARAEGVRRLDQPHRHEGGQHARRADHRPRGGRRSVTICRMSARPSAPARTRRTTTTKGGNRCSTAASRGSGCTRSVWPFSPGRPRPYVENPAIGRFEGTVFDPAAWTPRVPTAAFLRAREDDSFWAARRVMAFSDEMIRAVVKTGQYSDPQAEELLAERADPAAGHDRPDVSDGNQSGDQRGAGRQRDADLRQCRGQRRRRQAARRRLRHPVGALRQQHRRDRGRARDVDSDGETDDRRRRCRCPRKPAPTSSWRSARCSPANTPGELPSPPTSGAAGGWRLVGLERMRIGTTGVRRSALSGRA